MGCVTNVDFLRQMAFRGKMNYRFRKSALDFLLVIHYNYWCILHNHSIFIHLCFGWDFPTGAVLRNLNPQKVILTFWVPKRHILTPNHVYWAIMRQNLLRIVVCRRVDETRSKSRKKCLKKNRESGTIFHPRGEPLPLNRSLRNLAVLLHLTDVIIRSKFGID